MDDHTYRKETDALGEMKIPSGALYGIHSARAAANFPAGNQFSTDWYKAVGTTKAACYSTYLKFRDAALEKYGGHPALFVIPDDILTALREAAGEVAQGLHFSDFIVPAIQGGAGTSINMNVNEIISNVALVKTGHKPGDYSIIDPVAHANIYQSTNDVVPTALTVAAMRLLLELENEINYLRSATEQIERTNRQNLRTGFTQMQEAVPSSFGLLFSAYNEAFSRDWWRVSKCIERLKPVNLGGGATGTGMAVPRYFLMNIVSELRNITDLPLAHSENLADATSNLDKWVEAHAIVKALAVNLEKTVSDLRLLSSDISGSRAIQIPPRQVGSSIMPGKINPVIPEYVISVAHKVYSNDQLVSSLCSQGCLELNAYLPVIGDAFLSSIKLLIAACRTTTSNLLAGLQINAADSLDSLLRSPAVTTVLIPFIGYHGAEKLALVMKERGLNILEANAVTGSIEASKLEELLKPGNLLRSGFSLDDFNS
ncbi:MAG: lyase family protein [Bacteroidales bacterium]